MSLRTAQELMRIDRALARLPLLSAAFQEGEITPGHVRLLTRIASPKDEGLWLARARWMDVRGLARAVASAAGEAEAGDAAAAGAQEVGDVFARARGAGASAGEASEGYPPDVSDEEEGAIPLEIRAPAWLMRWWRETIVFAGQLIGRALRPGECLGVVLAECASGTGAALEAFAACTAEGADGADRGLANPGIGCGGIGGDSPTEGSHSARPEEASPDPPPTDMPALDATMRGLIASRQRQEAEMASHLACVRAAGSFLDGECRSLEQYARERLGLSARQMYYLLSLNRTLERLPDLARAFVAGRLTLRQTLLCGRVADKATTAAWVKRAEATTLRRLEDEVAFWELLREERPEVWGLLEGGPIPEGIVLVPGRNPRLHACAPGPSAATPADKSARRGGEGLHACACRASADEAANRGEIGGSCDRCYGRGGNLHASAGAVESSGASGRRERPAAGDLHVSAPLPPIDARAFLAALEADERGLPLPERRCTIRMRTDRETRRAWADSVAAYRSQSAEFLEEWEALALLLREFWKTWDNSQTRRQRRENPTLERDGWRCAVPGCRSVGTGRLNEHHIVFKSQGGALTDPGNLTTLCRGHHVALHDYDWLRCTGTAPDELLWELGVSPGVEPFLVFRGESRVGGVAM